MANTAPGGFRLLPFDLFSGLTTAQKKAIGPFTSVSLTIAPTKTIPANFGLDIAGGWLLPPPPHPVPLARFGPAEPVVTPPPRRGRGPAGEASPALGDSLKPHDTRWKRLPPNSHVAASQMPRVLGRNRTCARPPRCACVAARGWTQGFNLSTRDPLTTLFSVGGSRAGHGSGGAASGVTGYDNTDQTDIVSGTSRVSGAWIGQAVVLDPGEIWTVNRVLRDTRGTGGAMSVPPASVGGYGAFACCWHSTDDDVGYIATIGLDTGQTTDDNLISMVARFDLETLDSFTHTAYVVDHDAPYSAPLAGAQIPLAVSKIVQYGAYLFVAANHYIYVFRADNLTYIKRVRRIRHRSAGHWVFHLRGARLPLGGNHRLGGDLWPGCGGHIKPRRSLWRVLPLGLSLYQIQYADDTLKTPTAVGGNCLRRWAIPQGTEDGDDGYEDHRTFRPSEYGVQRPRGGLVYALAIDTGGDVFFTRTNQGGATTDRSRTRSRTGRSAT